MNIEPLTLSHNYQNPSAAPNPAVIPAIAMPLKGAYLVEASAGTGKTWTLSALVVRLIIEGRRDISQMVATTFTRAAAAQLSRKIRERLEHTLHVLSLSLTGPNTLEEQRQATENVGFKAALELVKADGSKPDALLEHLLMTLAPEQRSRAMGYLKLALLNYDHFYVGTLDSLCQKLMREFSFEIGQNDKLNISSQEEALQERLVSEAWRKWQAQQPPLVVQLMQHRGLLETVEHHVKRVKEVLNHLAIPVEPCPMPFIDTQRLEQIAQRILKLTPEQLNELDEFFDSNGTLRKHIKKNMGPFNSKTMLENIIVQLEQHGAQVLFFLNNQKGMEKIREKFQTPDMIKEFFKLSGRESDKTNAPTPYDLFVNLPTVNVLEEIARFFAKIDDDLRRAQLAMRYFMIEYVRTELPKRLLEYQETTFSQQMHVLANALTKQTRHSNEPGLGEQIADRYPVALVDEFQDTNSDQGRVIYAIYQAEFNKQHQDNRFLVMVGDPKQSIYRFRGGDVQTFVQVKKQLKQNFYTLNTNRRSVPALIQNLNALFKARPELGAEIYYTPVDWPSLPTSAPHQPGPAPLKIMAMTEEYKTAAHKPKQVAWQIVNLLRDTAPLLIEGRPVKPQDIAVLGSSHKVLSEVQAQLAHYHIPVWRASRDNVFNSQMARELLTLLECWLQPYNTLLLNRVLVGRMVGQAIRPADDTDHAEVQNDLKQQQRLLEGERWHKFGFLVAWQSFAQTTGVWQNLAKEQDAERHLVNLRHLIELLHAQSSHLVGPHHLLKWLARQIQQPKDQDAYVERRLASQNGVQLMTIHTAKGLEFPIVFVLQTKPTQKDTENVYLYTKTLGDHQQRLITLDKTNSEAQHAHQLESMAEFKRLFYVAVTRAQYYLYVFADHSTKPSKGDASPIDLNYWIGPDPEQWIKQHDLEQQVDILGPIEQPLFMVKQDKLPEPAPTLQPEAVPHIRQKAWSTASFSKLNTHTQIVDTAALAQSLLSDADDENLEADGLESEGLEADLLDQATVKASPIEHANQNTSQTAQTSTPTQPDEGDTIPLPSEGAGERLWTERGTEVGTFLHHCLEFIDPTNTTRWTDIFNSKLNETPLKKPVQTSELIPWFKHIVNAPLLNGATLRELDMRHRVREMEFIMYLNPEGIPYAKLRELFKRYHMSINQFNEIENVRYINGEIDLVYFHNNKYYIVDYKSNDLRFNRQEVDFEQVKWYYTADKIKDNVIQSGYYLQAALYLLALYRYLKQHLPADRIENSLGGVTFLYLRGLYASDTEHGLLHWQPAFGFIQELDSLLTPPVKLDNNDD